MYNYIQNGRKNIMNTSLNLELLEQLIPKERHHLINLFEVCR